MSAAPSIMLRHANSKRALDIRCMLGLNKNSCASS